MLAQAFQLKRQGLEFQGLYLGRGALRVLTQGSRNEDGDRVQGSRIVMEMAEQITAVGFVFYTKRRWKYVG
jgi:hypothetical protein